MSIAQNCVDTRSLVTLPLLAFNESSTSASQRAQKAAAREGAGGEEQQRNLHASLITPERDMSSLDVSSSALIYFLRETQS